MEKKKKQKGNKQIYSSDAARAYRGDVSNSKEEWDVIESDVLGSYTGTGQFDLEPVQDADDL